MAGHIAFAMISLVLGLTACATTPELASPGSRSFEGPVYRIKTPVEIATKPGFRQRCESRVETVRPDQSPRVTRRTWLSDVWPHPDGRRRVTRYLVDSERSATAGSEDAPLYAAEGVSGRSPFAFNLGGKIDIPDLSAEQRNTLTAIIRNEIASSNVRFLAVQGRLLRTDVSDETHKRGLTEVLRASNPAAEVTRSMDQANVAGMATVAGRNAIIIDNESSMRAVGYNGATLYTGKDYTAYDVESGGVLQRRTKGVYRDIGERELVSQTSTLNCSVEILTGEQPPLMSPS